MAALPLLAQERNLYMETVRTPEEIIVVANNQSRESAQARVAELRRQNAERKAAFHQRVLEKYDADKDGMLNEEEMAAWQAAQQKAYRDCLLEQYDTNKDGTLDEQEKAAMLAKGKPAGEAEGELGVETSFHALVLADTPEEARERMAELRRKHEEDNAARRRRVLDKYDVDKDGKLNEEEMAAWQAARRQAYRDYLSEQGSAESAAAPDGEAASAAE